MENASKALLIAGAILLCILIIAIGMFIYNSAQSTITDSMNSLSTQEVEAFNNQFSSYEGTQTGSNLKALMGRLIANAETYSEEPAKIPAVYIDQLISDDSRLTEIGAIVDAAGATQNYIDIGGLVRNKAESKHEYYVQMSYQANGLIDVIRVYYNEDEVEDTEVMHRAEVTQTDVAGGE